MARRKSAYADEGTDSDDSVVSDGAQSPSRKVPSFVPSKRRAFPAFVSSSANTTTMSAERNDNDDDPDPVIERRSFGAGLGTKKKYAPQMHERTDDDEVPARTGLGSAPTPMSAGPALSRTSGTGSFDPAALMRQMGWSGGGLGKHGTGIVNPIEVKMRPNRAGVAFDGRRETAVNETASKGKHSGNESRRRTNVRSRQSKKLDDSDEDDGYGDDDDDDDADADDGDDHGRVTSAAAWKRRNKAHRVRVVYRTYDEMVAEAAGELETTILDARGSEIRQVDSVAAALAQGQPAGLTNVHEHIPELQHNVTLLCRQSKEALDRLARHGAGIRDRQRWLQRDLEASRVRAEKATEEHERLTSVMHVITTLCQSGENSTSLDDLAPAMERVAWLPGELMEQFQLDEAVAGALVPALRHTFADWDPLAEPHRGVQRLASWLCFLAPAFTSSAASHAERPMTPWESVIWNIWMPIIRSALTNTWDVHDAAPAVALVETWRDILPPFVLDNVLDQLIIPKLERAVQGWTPNQPNQTQAVPLHVFVLPWLPIGEARLVSVLGEARRKWRSVLASWHVRLGIPAHFLIWRSVFTPKEWEALLLERIVPAMTKALRTQFHVDPGQQDMRVLDGVLAWQGVLRDSVLNRLFETEVAPRWLDILHAWITQTDADLAEIAAWYEFWRGWFASKATIPLQGVTGMFRQALQHINAALDRGHDRVTTPRPVVSGPTAAATASATAATTPVGSALGSASTGHARQGDAPPPTLEDVSFRHIVEERASERDLFVRSLNKLEPSSGFALLRVARHVDGKFGTTFYLDDDVIFVALEQGTAEGRVTYEPVSLGELLDRASRA